MSAVRMKQMSAHETSALYGLRLVCVGLAVLVWFSEVFSVWPYLPKGAVTTASATFKGHAVTTAFVTFMCALGSESTLALRI